MNNKTKSRKLIVLLLIVGLFLVNIETVYARRHLFSRRSQTSYSSPQRATPVGQSDPKNSPSSKSSSANKVETSHKSPTPIAKSGSLKPAPVYNHGGLKGSVRAVHIKDPQDSSQSWTVYRKENKSGPVYEVKNEKTGEIGGSQKIPSQVKVYLLLDDPKTGSWQKDSKGAPKWVEQGQYSREDMNFYAAYNRKGKDNLFVADSRLADKALVKEALGIDSQRLDPNRGKMEEAFGRKMLEEENIRVVYAERWKAEAEFGQKMLEDEKLRVIDLERIESENAFGRQLYKQALIDAEIAEIEQQLKINALAEQMLADSYERDRKAIQQASLDGLRQQIEQAGLDPNAPLDYKKLISSDVLAAGSKVYGDDPFAIGPADFGPGQPLEISIPEVITSLEGIAKGIVDPAMGGLKALAGAGKFQLNEFNSQFKQFANQLVHAEEFKTKNFNPYGVAYSEIKKIPHFEAYDQEGWRPVKNMPATYGGEEILKAYTGRNLADTKADSIIFYWGKESGRQAAAVWYYQKNIGSVPDQHFQGQAGLAKLNKPIKIISPQQEAKEPLKAQKLEKLTKVNLNPKGFDEDSYGGPSAERWRMDQARKQQMLSEPQYTVKDMINEYSSVYEGIIRSGGYAKLIKEGRPKYLSGEITDRVHYGILADYASRQAALAKKQGNWQQWGAWQKEYGKHNFQYNMQYLGEKATKILP
ncbi:MAG: hypothetical protein K9L86_00240 [Candidatus Omnitrophica bacterium]|nr:hypothetical protein [Candidatus Omnitrophota bacterium]